MGPCSQRIQRCCQCRYASRSHQIQNKEKFLLLSALVFPVHPQTFFLFPSNFSEKNCPNEMLPHIPPFPPSPPPTARLGNPGSGTGVDLTIVKENSSQLLKLQVSEKMYLPTDC